MTRGQRFLLYVMVAMLATTFFRDVTNEGTGKTLYVWTVSLGLTVGIVSIARWLDKRQ